jgi:frataxin
MNDPAFTDISYGSGILKIQWKNEKTFVINRQAPNKQIWYSSPVR